MPTCALQRELERLKEAVNTKHVQPRLGGSSPAQYRQRHKLQKLPPRHVIPLELFPIAAGQVTFIRQVTIHGSIHLLNQTFKIGRRPKGQYVKAALDTQRAQLSVYSRAVFSNAGPIRSRKSNRHLIRQD